MAIRFRTILSSSSGNCLLVQTETTNLLIDCGFRSQRTCKEALTEALGDPSDVSAVIVTHNHGDHISYSSLKVLDKSNIPVYVYEGCRDQLKHKHFKGYSFENLKLKTFTAEPFEINDLTVEPVEVPHHPDHKTFAFVIRYKGREKDYKILIAADFSDGAALVEHLKDADLIYIESNHDLGLLSIFPNFNSFFHMNNPATARLLLEALSGRNIPPQAVVLGHLSNQRNEPEKAIKEIRDTFENSGHEINFDLQTAPKFETSKEIEIS